MELEYEWEVVVPASNSSVAIGQCDDLEEAKARAEAAARKEFGEAFPGFRVRMTVDGFKDRYRAGWPAKDWRKIE